MNVILPRAVPFGAFIAFIALSGPLDSLAQAISMDPRWWYGVRIVVVAALLAWFLRDYVELRSPGKVRITDWLLSLAIGAVIFVLWISLDVDGLTFGDASGFDARTEGRIDWGLALSRLAGAVLIVPVMEELFWRSFLMRWLRDSQFLSVDPRRIGFRALALSSVVFALEHHLWFAGLLAGFAYGWLYIRTGDLWIPIAAHATTNGLLGAWVLYTGSWRFW